MNIEEKLDLVLLLYEQNINKKVSVEIRENCSEFLSEIQRPANAVYRGFKKLPNTLTKIEVRDRQPKGDQKLFTLINKWLSSNGLTRRDHAVFVTSDLTAASRFGTPYVCFPIGACAYTYVKSSDFNYTENATDYNPSAVRKALEKSEDVSSFFSNTNLIEAIKNKWEIWFDCKSYYLLNLRTWDKIKNSLF